jgi:peptidoglycan/xylan/chitin deacetylase (PgdA/CDA1 family)
MGGLTYLMYHEIGRTGAAPARSDGGYLRYVIAEAAFEQQLDTIARAGLHGIPVGTAVEADNQRPSAVVLTFDDGCASDLAVAAPRLAQRDWGATFYVTVEHVDRPGFLTRAQLRELAALGFEIGSHAFQHVYLTALGTVALRAQLVDSRRWLENTIGREVRHLSCPGGRWSPLVAQEAADAGYISVTTSRPVVNPKGADLRRLGRFAVTSATEAPTFGGMLGGRLPLSDRCKERITSLSRSLLGDRRYDALRDRVLGR